MDGPWSRTTFVVSSSFPIRCPQPTGFLLLLLVVVVVMTFGLFGTKQSSSCFLAPVALFVVAFLFIRRDHSMVFNHLKHHPRSGCRVVVSNGDGVGWFQQERGPLVDLCCSVDTDQVGFSVFRVDREDSLIGKVHHSSRQQADPGPQRATTAARSSRSCSVAPTRSPPPPCQLLPTQRERKLTTNRVQTVRRPRNEPKPRHNCFLTTPSLLERVEGISKHSYQQVSPIGRSRLDSFDSNGVGLHGPLRHDDIMSLWSWTRNLNR